MSIRQPFEAVVAAHSATVLRVCRAVVGIDDADDAWSETFLAAMRVYPDLPSDANLEAWLVTIAHRKAIDVTRARQRRAVPVETVPERMSTTQIPGQHDDELWQAVKALPDKQRQAVAYHYLGGLHYKDVAGILGGTTDAARRAASDGMKTLRASIAGPHSKEATR